MIPEQQVVTCKEEDMSNENHVEHLNTPIKSIDNKEEVNGSVSFNITFRTI